MPLRWLQPVPFLPFDKAISLTTDSPFSLSGFLVFVIDTCFPSIFSRPLFVASLGILSGSPPLLFFLFSLSLLLLLLLPPSSPSLSLRPSLPCPYFSQGVCPKWLRPTWQHLFVVLAQSGRSSPCRAPLARCHLCFAAILECCSYVPPMPPAPTMPMDVVDHLLNVSCTLLTTCSCFSYYPVLHEDLSPLIYTCLDPFYLLLPDDVGSVGSACGIIVRPILLSSSILSSLSHHSSSSTHLRIDLGLLLDHTSPLGNLSYSQPYLVLWQFTHSDLYFHRSQKNTHKKKYLSQ